MDALDPATGEQLDSYEEHTEQEVDDALERASGAILHDPMPTYLLSVYSPRLLELFNDIGLRTLLGSDSVGRSPFRAESRRYW